MDRKKKALIYIVIGFLILGLILVYFPFFISQPALQRNIPPPPSTEDSEIQSVNTQEPLPVTSTPEGFSGLEEETQSLEEIDNLLEGF